MTSDLLLPGLVIDVDLHPTFNGQALAGTHPFIVLGFLQATREVYGLACTSHRRREATYLLPRGILSLWCDTYVVTGLVREVDEHTWRLARPLGQLPTVYLDEVYQKARRALRHKGLAA